MKRRNGPSTHAAGYGYHHQMERKRWKPQVDAGSVLCARCGYLIVPGTPWDLDHDDADRSRYLGPSHAKCNRGAPRRKVVLRRSRIW